MNQGPGTRAGRLDIWPTNAALGVALAFPLYVAAPAVQGPPPPPPPPPPPAPPKHDKWAAVPANALRVGGGIQPPKKIKHVSPVYPPDASEAGVQGIVILEAVINPEGKIQDTRILESVQPALDEAATAAVRQWEFAPTVINGKAVPVVVTLTMNFSLK